MLRAVSLAVCMATQMWQPFLVATVMITTTSRATGSSVVLSKIAVSFTARASRRWPCQR